MPHNPGHDADEPEVTPGGSEILRHEPGTRSEHVAYLPEPEMVAICNHLAEHFGPHETVYHELVSEVVHLDLVPILATDERPFHVVSTMGMSALPMTIPEDTGLPRHAELLIVLPPEWPLDEESLKEDEHFWPMGWLKQIAHIPSDYDTFLAPGHTIPTGEPPEPIPGTGFVCFMVLPLIMAEEESAGEVTIGEKTVAFFQVIPLYPEEMALKLEEGVDALLERFEEAEFPVESLFDPQRPNVALS